MQTSGRSADAVSCFRHPCKLGARPYQCREQRPAETHRRGFARLPGQRISRGEVGEATEIPVCRPQRSCRRNVAGAVIAAPRSVGHYSRLRPGLIAGAMSRKRCSAFAHVVGAECRISRDQVGMLGAWIRMWHCASEFILAPVAHPGTRPPSGSHSYRRVGYWHSRGRAENLSGAASYR